MPTNMWWLTMARTRRLDYRGTRNEPPPPNHFSVSPISSIFINCCRLFCCKLLSHRIHVIHFKYTIVLISKFSFLLLYLLLKKTTNKIYNIVMEGLDGDGRRGRLGRRKTQTYAI